LTMWSPSGVEIILTTDGFQNT